MNKGKVMRASIGIAALFVGGLLFSAGIVRGAEEARADVTTPAVKYRVQQQRLALAQEDPRKFLESALKYCQSRVQDYTCLFVKQERLEGKKLTKEQHIRVKFRAAPFAVFMKWVRNPSLVDRVLYVKGRYKDKALVKPAGLLSWLVLGHVKRPVNGPDSAKMSRRRLDQFGFTNAYKLIMDVNARADKAGELKFEFKGEGELNKRKTFVLERFLPNKPTYPDQHLVVHIDQEWLVPIGSYCYDARGRLLGKYEYRDVKFNVGLSWKEFSPKANGL